MLCLGNAYKCTQMYNECIEIGFKWLFFILLAVKKNNSRFLFVLYLTNIY